MGNNVGNTKLNLYVKSPDLGYLALAAAIVNTAIEDYNKATYNGQKGAIKNFFKSEFGELLLDATHMEYEITKLINKVS